MSEYLHVKDVTPNPASLGLIGGFNNYFIKYPQRRLFPYRYDDNGNGNFLRRNCSILCRNNGMKKGNMFGSIAFMSYGAFWLSLVFIRIEG